MKRSITRRGSPPRKKRFTNPVIYCEVDEESSCDDYVQEEEEEDDDYNDEEYEREASLKDSEKKSYNEWCEINDLSNEEDDYVDNDNEDYDANSVVEVISKRLSKRKRANGNRHKYILSRDETTKSKEINLTEESSKVESHWEGILPDELLLEIFKYHDQLQLISNGGVCKQWRKVAQDPQFWRALIYENSHGKKNFQKICIWCIASEPLRDEILYINLVGVNSTKYFRKFTQLLPSFNNLLYLNIKGVDCMPSTTLQKTIENCKKLKWLNIGYCPGITNHKIFNFPNPENITHLSLHHTGIRFTALQVLQKLTNLKMLLLIGCRSLAGSQTNASCDFPSLEYLDISYTDLNDLGICNIIWESKNLNVLMLSGCKYVTGNFLGAKSLVNLTGLDISRTNIEDQYLPHILTFTKLIRLDISWCKYSEATLFEFVEQLKDTKSCSFEEFYCVGTYINDETVLTLVASCPVGALINLASCRNLSRSLRSQYSKDYSEFHRFIFPPPPFTVHDCLNIHYGNAKG